MGGLRKAPAKKAPGKKPDLGDYNEVKDRIAEFREKYPDARLRPADPTKPYDIIVIGGQSFIAYTAAAYRDENDTLPGIGCAWEPVPGKTNYTRDSELQNAETSAWGRAMVAALAVDAHKGIASADEMRGKRQDPATEERDPTKVSPRNVDAIVAKCTEYGVSVAEATLLTTEGRTDDPSELLTSEVPAMRDIVMGLHVNSSPPGEAPQGESTPDHAQETARTLEAGAVAGPPDASDGPNPFTQDEGPYDEAFA